jgi:hypothetical protein
MPHPQTAAKKSPSKVRRSNRAWLRLDVLERRLTPAFILPELTDRPSPASNPTLPSEFPAYSPPTSKDSPKFGTPTIAAHSQVALGGQSVTLTGDRLSAFSGPEAGRDSEFVAYGATSNPPLALTPAEVLRLDGPRAAISLSETLTPDMYLLWSGNANGWSRPVPINRADATWASPSLATPGSTVSLHGRSLDLGDNIRRVWLEPVGVSKYSGPGEWLTITSANPFRLDCQLPANLPAGEGHYLLYAHNGHGRDMGWSAPVQVSVRAPLAITGDKYDVKEKYGAKGDGTTDDYQKIANAIEAAAADPDGGTVYFPSGTYAVGQTLDIKALGNVRFEGATKDAQGNATPPPVLQPLADLTVLIQSGNSASNLHFEHLNFRSNDRMIRVNNVDPVLVRIREAEDLTFKNVTFTAVDNAIGAIPLDLEQGERITITNSVFLQTGNVDLIATRQVRIDACKFYGALNVGQMLYFSQSSDVSVTGCEARDYVAYNPAAAGDYRHAGGRFLVGQGTWDQNFYVAFNQTFELSPKYDATHQTTADYNSGEQILFEQLGPLTHGRVVAATTYTVQIAGLSHDYLAQAGGRLVASVIDGKGLGQRRRVTTMTYDAQTNLGTVTVESPWAVEPNATTSVMLGGPLDNIVVYKNTLDGRAEWLDLPLNESNAPIYAATAGVQVFGVAHMDIVENTITDVADGIVLYPTQVDFALGPDRRPQLATNWFDHVAGNSVTHAFRGISLNVTNPGQREPNTDNDWVYHTIGYGTAILGSVVRDNDVLDLRDGKNGRSAVISLDSQLDNRPLDLVIFERNGYAYTAATAAEQAAVTGIRIGADPTATNTYNVVFRANTFGLAAGGTGVRFTDVATVGRDSVALFDNTYGDAGTDYDAVIGPSVEVPTRIVALSWQPSTSTPPPVAVTFRNAGVGTTAKGAVLLLRGADWFTASVQAVPADETADGTIHIQLNNAVLSKLGNGTYAAPLEVTWSTRKRTLTVQVEVTGNANVGPYLGRLPMLRQTEATLMQAEDFDLGGQGKGYVDFSPGNGGTANYRPGDDVDISPYGGASPQPYAVVLTERDEWLAFTVNVIHEGQYRIEARVRNSDENNYFWITDSIGGVETSITGDVFVTETTEWTTFRVEGNVDGDPYTWPVGLHTIRLYFGKDMDDANGTVAEVDWLRLTPRAVSLPFAATAPTVSVLGATQFEAEEFDRGGPGVAYADNTVRNTLSAFRDDEDVELTLALGTRRSIVGEVDEWVNFTADVRDEGQYEVTVRGADDGSASFRIQALDGKNTVVAETAGLTISGAGDATGRLSLNPDVKSLRLRFDRNGTGGTAGRIDSFRVTPVERSLVPDAKSGNVAGADHDAIGTRIAINVPGTISALRFYKAAGEPPNHTLKLWNSSGALVGLTTITDDTNPDWYTVPLSQPIDVNPGLYTVSVNVTSQYVSLLDPPFGPAEPDVLAYIAGTFSSNSAALPNLPLGVFGFTDLVFTPRYAT